MKLSKFKEITNVLPKTKTEIILFQARPSKIELANGGNKIINLVAQQER